MIIFTQTSEGIDRLPAEQKKVQEKHERKQSVQITVTIAILFTVH